MPRHAGTFQVKRIVCGDALLLIPTLPDRSVNLCLTSPPYAMQRKRQYGGVPENDYPAWMVAIMAATAPCAPICFPFRSSSTRIQPPSTVLPLP